MRILVTNDDGAGAHGLSVLHQIARQLSDDVWIVAPETNQSGSSHALTLQVPLRYREVGERAFAVRGTPADCVIMGVKHVLKDRAPDLVLSGVNHGANLAEDVTYSGTIAGAMEGTLLGIRSIAMSLTIGFDPEGKQHWKTPLTYGARLVEQLLANDWPAGTLMNVNYPDLAPGDVRGIAATRQGRRDQGGLKIEERSDTWGAPYFWVGFSHRRSDPVEGTDLRAIADGMISVTPLYLNLTHEATRETLGQTLTLDGGGRLKDAG
ncbi:5'/3'-nucleotidase SurE [Hyphomicrobium sp.]|uniref:5'/3'-nucleotidase SurE n=1 Tax=Hyphomicrobium sp. TaxID=82 RepID=UPI002BFDF272|nr:5'/3'-nucleotidase SurE [Hyphomicrobium sp.]HRN88327.1 5'/3'-nucleotidase SurE [Hyphomicrobium sp.]HRQ28207.1 5'/3'-nucleotidase SurE [Hyphomicrobium sp.]